MLFNVIMSKNVYDIISLNKISNLCIETFLMIRKLITLNCSAKKVLSHHQLFFNYLTDVRCSQDALDSDLRTYNTPTNDLLL